MNVPAAVPKPPLARWLFDRNMSIRAAARLFDTSHETLRRVVLPLADPGARVPYPALMRRIIELTNGEIRPGDWYPPQDRAA